ncbi:MAG: nickel transporter [Rhodoglobus sp.]|nr:nickel transporter [Rhodoglobus sp.]
MIRLLGTPRAVLLSIVGLAVLAWGVTAVLDAGAGSTALGGGLAMTAFALGMKHAFDADHLAAIDNTTRKLVGEQRDASSVGVWFALGHSTVVLVAVGFISVGASALGAQIADEASPLSVFTGAWGPVVSSGFLIVIGSVNLVALIGMLTAGHRARPHGHARGGLVTLVLRRVGGTLDRPWKMFVVGLAFGLGFDTASTIALLLLSGGVVAVPWYVALTVPLLFTAGMVLCDGLNGIVVSRAYAWTVRRPRQHAFYNGGLLTVSVAAAFGVGLTGIYGALA